MPLLNSQRVPSGSEELLAKLQQDATLNSNASAKEGLQDMEKLFSYLKAFNIVPKVGPLTRARVDFA